ncbi:diguanylate cyclase [Marinomonas ostreistagni]|uniref:GGDEF domain-containing response regulator n=1 Tax=Marinomonas ostreistagni TaxID=359209 RepID=UPI00194E2F0E|nr:diguanylate cyclase [Marinomonas ostreistagni]MBM6550101.1 diguanylate cyclase [Marinomonas ostreistagni]
MKILIAEDTNSDRLLLRLRLEKLGHEVIDVADGQALIDTFQSHSEVIDLVVADLNMPVKSGLDAISEIRAIQGDYESDWVPIIILSGSVSDDDVERCIEAGADDYLIKPIQHKVLAAKLLAMDRLAQMRHKLVSMNKRLEALSTTDYLTDLMNRRAFETSLRDEVAKAERYNQSLSIAVLDIDHFKNVNDTFGHDAGDMVLQEFSRRLRERKRAGDMIGRIGGEEFALCLPHTSADEALSACERYREVLKLEPLIYDGHELHLTCSVGVCEYSQIPSELEFIKCADLALYQAKTSGRDRVVLYSKK